MRRSNTRSISLPFLARLTAVVCGVLMGTPAIAEIELILKNTFIEKYKNRTSIEDQCVVDHSKGKANPASKDGDMHVAVRCPKEIALALVAEIMNAGDHPEAIALTKTAESDG